MKFLLPLREALIPILPDLDRPLQKLVEGTGLLQGGVSDYILAVIIALLFPILRYILDATVYDWIARKVLHFPVEKKSDERPTQEMLDTLSKFKESAYKCGVQIAFTIFLAIIALPKPWFVDSFLFWKGCQQLPCVVEPSVGERFIYCLELGFYIQAVPMLFVWETKRKDRLEVFAHHVATIILIGYSYWLNVTRVGVMVLVCHEANDIFLEAAKMARYAKKENTTTFFFVTFMLSWFVTRMYYYLNFVIRSTLFEASEYAAALNAKIQPHFGILNCFLLFLYCLHIYWSYLIVRIAVRQLVSGDLDDIREKEHVESEGEEIQRYTSTTLPQHKHAQSVGAMPSNI